MTRDDIIRMAREANFYESEIGNAEDCFVHFATIVAAAEREACVKKCEQIGQHGIITQCVNAIRARGQS